MRVVSRDSIRLLSLLMLCCLPCSARAAAPGAHSLRALYTQALQQSERVARSAAEIDFARARFGTVLSGALPTLEATASEFLQESVTTGNAFSDSFTRLSSPEVALTLTQPLFHGLKELHGLRAARAYRAQTEAALEEARRLLFGDVSAVYFAMARFDQAIRTTQRIIAVLAHQTAVLYRQAELGKSRATEVASAEAELAFRRAELEQLRGERAVAAEAMAFLTGLERIVIAIPPAIPTAHYTLDQYVAMVEQRADVRAAQAASLVATHQMKAARADLWPQADLTANYYPYRSGFQRDITWDVQLSLSVPLTPVRALSGFRESKVRARQEALKTRELARLAVAELRKNHAGFQAAVRQYRSFATAAARAEASYHLQSADYDQGLIDLLPLLEVQRRWFEMLKARDTARIQAAVAHTQLELAAGVVP